MIEKLYTAVDTINLLTILACVYNLLLGMAFVIIHRKKKAFHFFDLFFYLALIIISYTAVLYLQKDIVLSFILSTLVFIVAEYNHQFMRKNYEQQVTEYQNKLVGKQVDEVHSIYLTMRGWRHDYHNHMQTLKAHLALQQYDLLKKYLNELENDLDIIDCRIKSGNVNLDATLNSKLSLAEAKDITIKCSANVPGEIAISDIDLCVLIGNLLDNALEACDTMTNGEEKFLRVYISILKQQLYICITNSTKEVVRKFNYEYISNKIGNHGHGLKRVDLIVNKYQGYINRKNEPGVFVTEIMLPL